MNISFALALAVAAAVFVSGCTQSGPPATNQPPAQPPAPPVPPASPETHAVAITGSGFSPQTLAVNAGDTVVWTNADTTPAWPASAVHPTHTAYPGSGIEKCGTAEQAGIFDACGGLANGDVFSFTFTETGSWKYHDHLNPGHFGTINVQ